MKTYKVFRKKAATVVPTLINSSANILSNFAIMFFLLYFMLTNGRPMESFLQRFIPLKEENVDLLGKETKNIIKANAIGIPVMAILQGTIATIGYWIFGRKRFRNLGFCNRCFFNGTHCWNCHHLAAPHPILFFNRAKFQWLGFIDLCTGINFEYGLYCPFNHP
jgi:hypothetical protein